MISNGGFILVWAGIIILLLVILDLVFGVSGVSDRYNSCVDAGGTLNKYGHCVPRMEGF